MLNVQPRIYGVGTYTSVITVLPLASGLVQRWLPPELELAPQTLTPPNTHPVNFMFGQQQKVQANLLPWFQMNYFEFAVVVPHIQFRGAVRYTPRGPHLYTPLLFLDQWPAIWAGDLAYGFPKRHAQITWTDNVYTVTRAGQRQAQGTFAEAQATLTAPEYEKVTQLLCQPTVSQSPWGGYVYSVFDWRLSPAQVQAQSAQIEIAAQVLPNQPAVRGGGTGLQDLATGGAFWLQPTWTLTPPQRLTPAPT